MNEKNRKKLLEIMKQPGNDVCADCNAPLGKEHKTTREDSDWGAYNLGVFLCVHCATVHRMLGVQISRTKSIPLDQWTDEQVAFMEAHGNLKAKEKYEQYVPKFYRRPTEKDCQVLREQWIRAKYERHEFMDLDKQTYRSGKKTGYLWKKGRDDNRFQHRLFVLSEDDNTLKYYNKENAKEPKATILLSELNAVFTPEKIGNPNGLQLSYIKENMTRNIYLYTNDGKDIVDWYMAIRHAKFNRLKVAYPGASDEDLALQLTRDFLKEGWLAKTGPKGNEAYRRRWFSLDGRLLSYYSDPLDAFPKGEVVLGTRSDGFTVREGVPPGRLDQLYSFTQVTPTRQYYLSADLQEERRQWMEVLMKVIDTPQSRQDKMLMSLVNKEK
ncbi:arf-GAP with dual PH domain-containing protein 1 isoform X1 [Strongylocentrotus purpuratus]|uniref:Centaurin alpha n=1 Tax=Strongylocentrotus purpuratus TaxID=7668 RepID=A0A7M7NS87_STRPU|nr:arf-GAP with dual PH domain-containing protein 1 isoform X1 [Strongylocentrotus purpuratus]